MSQGFATKPDTFFTNVDTEGVADSDLMRYNATTGLWEPASPASVLATMMVVDRVYSSSTPSLGAGSYSNLLQASLDIPTDWTTYDVEAHWSGYLADASGGSTGTAVCLLQMVHQSGNFDTGSHVHEMEAQNNHDLNNVAGHDYIEGLGALGTRLFTFQGQVSAGNATNLSRPRLIVRAWRTA